MSRILTGKLVTYMLPYQNGKEKFIARVKIDVGNGRNFYFLKLSEPGKKETNQFEWNGNEPTGAIIAREQPEVSIIPTNEATESFDRFCHLSDIAGPVTILTSWVNVQKSRLPSVNKIAQYKDTKMNPDLWKNLKSAMSAYEESQGFDTAKAVIIAYKACPDKTA